MDQNATVIASTPPINDNMTLDSSLFDRAFALTIGVEGGYVNDPLDPGGETKYGITKATYPTEDIVNLTLDRAKEIYQRDYWVPAGCQELPWGPAYAVFDCAVNQGLGRAKELKEKTPQGPGFVVEFLSQRAMHYISLPTFARFGLGWIRRLFRVAIASAL